jgi:hypothetical protein
MGLLPTPEHGLDCGSGDGKSIERTLKKDAVEAYQVLREVVIF